MGRMTVLQSALGIASGNALGAAGIVLLAAAMQYPEWAQATVRESGLTDKAGSKETLRLIVELLPVQAMTDEATS